MALKVAILMDHISTVDVNGDSTFLLALEGQRRKHELYHFEPKNLYAKNSSAFATVQKLVVKKTSGNHFTLGPKKSAQLSKFDVILMRQDPPFDMSYITATHILELVTNSTMVVNNPAEVRNAPEKLFMLQYPDLIPPTLISNDIKLIKEFRNQYKDIIIKPLYGNGGTGVFHVTEADENLNSLIEMFMSSSAEPLMIQKYLPEVRNGDKRIILIDGEPAGATNRVPASGEARSNMHVGGRAEKSKITERDFEICATIGPELRRRGLVFVGIDVIGKYLTEINVTSPTGLQEINRFNKTNLETSIWDAIEFRL